MKAKRGMRNSDGGNKIQHVFYYRFYHESVRIIELFSSLKQWEKVREAVIAENAIQARTTTTLKRVSA